MLARLLKGLGQDRSGNVLFLAAASAPVLIAGAGLAMDTVQWTLWKRQIQREADSAALAGAFAVAQGFPADDAANADIDRNALVALSATPRVENAPDSGAYAGNASAVRVTLQTERALPFSSLLGITAPTISGVATAAVVHSGDYCVITLDKTDTAGISLQGNADVNMGCGMIANSQGENAVSASGSSTVAVAGVAAVGGLSASSNYVSPTKLLPYSLPQSDPYADLPTPSPTDCVRSGLNVSPNATTTISPGCYSGMNIKGTVNMQPGVYYVDGSSFKVGAQATVNGSGVTIILTSTDADTDPSSIARLDVNGGATMNLSASTSGTYAGVLFYQDRRALDSHSDTMNGNADSFLQGALYFPSQALQFSGTAGMSTACLQIVSLRLTFTGDSSVSNDCPSDSGASSFTGTLVRLVA